MRDDFLFVGAKVFDSGLKAFDVIVYFGVGMLFLALWVWLKIESNLAFLKRVGMTLLDGEVLRHHRRG